MSIKIMNRVWQEAQVGGSELLVLLALADFSDDDGRNIYPSIQTLSYKVRLTTTQTRRIVHNLVKSNFVEIVEPGGWQGKRNRSNEYRILLDNLEGTNILGGANTDDSTGTDIDVSTVLSSVRDDPSFNHHIETSSTDDAIALVKLFQANGFVYLDPSPTALATQLIEKHGWARCSGGLDKVKAAHEKQILGGRRGIVAPLAYLRSVLEEEKSKVDTSNKGFVDNAWAHLNDYLPDDMKEG